MNEVQAYARWQSWATERGSEASADATSWKATQLRDDLWVLAPGGRSNTLYIVTETTVRVVHPSRQSVSEALAEFGIQS